MFKRTALAMLAVFVTWSAMDFVIHAILLAPTYEATAELWRPEAEMKMGLMQLVTAISAVGFTLMYARLVDPKCMGAALLFGLIFGFISGISMGYGTYSFSPIPYKLALSWFLGATVEGIAGGFMLGLIVKPTTEPTTDN